MPAVIALPSKPFLSPGRALLVSMPDTFAKSELRFALEEVQMLETLCPSLKLTPIIPHPSQRLQVLEALRSCKVFHFAGHSELDHRKPSQSRILLDDWDTNPLTVADLRGRWFGERLPFLAYLSACN
jgi:CHAT domain-containing protein